MYFGDAVFGTFIKYCAFDTAGVSVSTSFKKGGNRRNETYH